MNKHYQSDLDANEPADGLTFQEVWAAMSAGCRWLVTAMAISAAMLLALAMFMATARADGFELPKPSCYLNAIDYRYKLADGPDAIVWWCDTASGLEENYRAGEVGGIKEFLFRIGGAGKDLFAADKQIFVRAATDPELTIVRAIEDAGEPRCYAQGTGKSQQVYQRSSDLTTLSAKLDSAGKVVYLATNSRMTCWDWFEIGLKRYCLASQLSDTKGRVIEANGYSLCRVDLAPEEGWE